jgi:hypothetical protein
MIIMGLIGNVRHMKMRDGVSISASSLSDFGRRKRECVPARPVFAEFAAP